MEEERRNLSRNPHISQQKEVAGEAGLPRDLGIHFILILILVGSGLPERPEQRKAAALGPVQGTGEGEGGLIPHFPSCNRLGRNTKEFFSRRVIAMQARTPI